MNADFLNNQYDQGSSISLSQVAVADGDTSEKTWFAVYGLVALILIAISPIAYHEGVSAFVLLVSYLSAVTLVKVFVKQSIDLGYPFPNTITAMHMLAVCIVTLIFERPSMDEALKVLPISVLNGLSLLTNNSAFLYGGVAFVSMIAANVPFMTFSLELLKGKRSLNFASAFSVGLVCAGSVCCVQGEVNVSLAAFVLATVSALLRAARGVWQHELVSVSLSPLRLVFWNGFWSGCITLVILGPNRNGILNGPAMSSICLCLVLFVIQRSFVTPPELLVLRPSMSSQLFRMMAASKEGLEGLRSLRTVSTNAQIGLLSSIVAAVCLNITQWYAMKAVGALMASIIGNLNLILVIALSIAWLHEQVTPWQFLGVLLLATGTFANKMLPACLSAQKGKEAKEPASEKKQ
eukprot:g2782.t1